MISTLLRLLRLFPLMAKPPPRAEFRGGFATEFRRPKRNFVAPPRNSPREARWRHPYFHPYSAVLSDIGP